jgi:hypothetical protein
MSQKIRSGVTSNERRKIWPLATTPLALGLLLSLTQELAERCVLVRLRSIVQETMSLKSRLLYWLSGLSPEVELEHRPRLELESTSESLLERRILTTLSAGR